MLMAIELMVSEMRRAIGEEARFQQLCKELPKDVADKLRRERRAKREREAEHRKALEIAHAGRTRNFWGN